MENEFQAEKEKEEKQNELGQHSRELNPFWKNGGTGLPPTEEELREKEKQKIRAEKAQRMALNPPKKAFVGDVKVSFIFDMTIIDS